MKIPRIQTEKLRQKSFMRSTPGLLCLNLMLTLLNSKIILCFLISRGPKEFKCSSPTAATLREKNVDIFFVNLTNKCWVFLKRLKARWELKTRSLRPSLIIHWSTSIISSPFSLSFFSFFPLSLFSFFSFCSLLLLLSNLSLSFSFLSFFPALPPPPLSFPFSPFFLSPFYRKRYNL